MIREIIEEGYNIYKDFYVDFEEYKDFIYHYTSPKGLDRILRSGKLWFTDADYLNDKEEGKYILKVLDKAKKKYKTDYNADDRVVEFLDGIDQVDNVKMFFTIKEDGSGNKYIDTKTCAGKAFVCCFSRDRDSLPMWRYYVKNNMYQGYSIGLTGSAIFYTRGQAMGTETGIDIYEVIYNEDVQVNAILELILKLDKYSDDAEEFKYAKYGFINALKKYKYIYKNPCFETEREVRAIMYLPVDKEEGIEYRMGHEGYVIPYIERSFDDLDMSITISPLTDAELAMRSLHDFLEFNNYKDVEIYKSECPIRY